MSTFLLSLTCQLDSGLAFQLSGRSQERTSSPSPSRERLLQTLQQELQVVNTGVERKEQQLQLIDSLLNVRESHNFICNNKVCL